MACSEYSPDHQIDLCRLDREVVVEEVWGFDLKLEEVPSFLWGPVVAKIDIHLWFTSHYPQFYMPT